MGVLSGIILFSIVYTGQNFVSGDSILRIAVATAIDIKLIPNWSAAATDPK